MPYYTLTIAWRSLVLATPSWTTCTSLEMKINIKLIMLTITVLIKKLINLKIQMGRSCKALCCSRASSIGRTSPGTSSHPSQNDESAIKIRTQRRSMAACCKTEQARSNKKQQATPEYSENVSKRPTNQKQVGYSSSLLLRMWGI